jgi:hypothetical protein
LPIAQRPAAVYRERKRKKKKERKEKKEKSVFIPEHE